MSFSSAAGLRNSSLPHPEAATPRKAPAVPEAFTLCALPPDIHRSPEFFQDILTSDQPVRVERIVSWGHVTPEGECYDQDRDEWVMVVQGVARLGFDDGTERQLQSGEALFLPAHLRHRVLFTSKPCVWLAIHGDRLCEAAPVIASESPLR